MKALLLAVCAALLMATASAAATPKAVNLVATPRIKNMLRASFLLFHHRFNRRYTARNVKGPLKGTTYYGRYGRTEYAFAVFSVLGDTTDQPELFKRPVGGLFRDVGDTGGEICRSRVPLALIKVWHLKRSSPGCFVPR
jgi:opacity protein-like surface antigen